MKAKEARALGRQIATRVERGLRIEAYGLLAPVLARRTPFAKLGLIGEALGAEPSGECHGGYDQTLRDFLDDIAARGTEGGWVVIGDALRQRLERDLTGTLALARGYIVAADVWYGADILGERVPGPGLVTQFELTLATLTTWREDGNAWVRRAVGVAAHFWAKRSRGAVALAPQAGALLAFLAPMFAEAEMEAVKGVGWGVKTLGRHYPDLVTTWLAEEILPRGPRHRSLMLRKAMTYLSSEQRQRVSESIP